MRDSWEGGSPAGVKPSQRLRRAGAACNTPAATRVAGCRLSPLRRGDANGEPNDLIATYRYDPPSPQGLRRAGGLNRRVRKILPASGGGSTAFDFYYNEAWQVLEVRKDPPSSANGGLRRAGPYGRVTVLNGDPAVDPDYARDANNTEWTPDPNGTPDWDNEVLYCGYRHDWETGLDHVRHRMLHPTAGRWVQRDPAGYVDGMSFCRHVKGSAVGEGRLS